MDGEAQKASLFGRIKEFFMGVKLEFSKIVFPNQEDLKKQTIAVLVSSVFISVLILIIDTILKYLLGFIL
ncbi:MAG: preprotein translocase subunit SecE [Eubacteriales bacterium]|nr:preprotein translocase subunit SecE [Eubacteriales bacterium]